MKNSLIKSLIFCLGAGSLIYYTMSNMLITTTGSLEYRYFWKTDKTPEKDDYLLFTLNHVLLGKEDLTVTKKIACAEGNRLAVKNRIFTCDGKALGRAKEFSLSGDELPLFAWDGVIPEGKVFLTGQHPDSFDSRYWGFFDLKQTHRVVFPLARGWL